MELEMKELRWQGKAPIIKMDTVSKVIINSVENQINKTLAFNQVWLSIIYEIFRNGPRHYPRWLSSPLWPLQEETNPEGHGHPVNQISKTVQNHAPEVWKQEILKQHACQFFAILNDEFIIHV